MFRVLIERRLISAFTTALIFIPYVFGDTCSAGNPKYIFLMIGDGMGIAQREAAEVYNSIRIGDEGAGRLVMNRLPSAAVTTTSSCDGTTDSAAGVTAIACGQKTKNGMIGITPDKKTRLKSVAFYAQKAGLKVGITTSVPLDHATPAGFYAHVDNRKSYYDIAIQLSQSGFDYFAGEPFIGASDGKTQGRKNPREYAVEAGYRIYRDQDGLNAITSNCEKIIWEAQIPAAIDRSSGDIVLADLVRKGIEFLDDETGFFMMVEGGKIDWAGHANDLSANIRETLDFDSAVAEAYSFYLAHSNDTLIVVTADHETGGMKGAFSQDSFDPDAFLETVQSQKMSGGAFAHKTRQWRQKELSEMDIYKEVVQSFGLQDLTQEETVELQQVICHFREYSRVDTRPEEIKRMYGSKNILVEGCLGIVSERCGVCWSTSSHSGVPVMTTSIGVGAQEFEGKLDNTDIARKLLNLIGQ